MWLLILIACSPRLLVVFSHVFGCAVNEIFYFIETSSHVPDQSKPRTNAIEEVCAPGYKKIADISLKFHLQPELKVIAPRIHWHFVMM